MLSTATATAPEVDVRLATSNAIAVRLFAPSPVDAVFQEIENGAALAVPIRVLPA